MVDVSIVNKNSPEAHWNRQADRQTDRRTGLHLSQADALTKKKVKKLFGKTKMGSKEILGPRNFEFKKFWIKKIWPKKT